MVIIGFLIGTMFGLGVCAYLIKTNNENWNNQVSTFKSKNVDNNNQNF